MLGPKDFQRFLKYKPELADKPIEEQLTEYRQLGIDTQTGFLRNERALESINWLIRLHNTGQNVRIASVGCSTGEEAYSILMQSWSQRERIKVVGYDINPPVLETAKKGFYILNLELREHEGWRIDSLGLEDQAYKIVEETGYSQDIQFLDDLTRHLSFQVHDILQDPLPGKFDVIVALNVLIHYAQKGRERILANLHESLNTGGSLLLDTPKPNRSYGRAWDSYLDWLKDLSEFGFERHLSSSVPVNVYKRIEV